MTDTTSGSTDDAGVDGLVTAVLTASRVLVGISARSLAAIEQTVTATQFRTLVVLSSRGELNVNGLAERLGVNASTAVRMIDKLVAGGLVTRRENPASRREVLLGLTDEGTAVVDEVTERRRAEIARVVDRMPAGRRGELVEALAAFAEAADEPQVGTGPIASGW